MPVVRNKFSGQEDDVAADVAHALVFLGSYEIVDAQAPTHAPKAKATAPKAATTDTK